MFLYTYFTYMIIKNIFNYTVYTSQLIMMVKIKFFFTVAIGCRPINNNKLLITINISNYSV